MAETKGFIEYACDVQTCTHKDYAQPDTDMANSYGERRRYDDNGVIRELLLCSEHIETYSKLVKACEDAYKAFERSGEYKLATQEEVDELTAQVAQLTEQYNNMRADRNAWIKKYDQLNAEYEEYKRTHPDEGGEQ